MSDNDKSETDCEAAVQEFLRKVEELKAGGLDHIQAFERACLEERIKNWPSKWGDDLRILIYGDFDPPESDMRFSDLGITVHKEKQENTVVGRATCVLQATVSIQDKTVQSLLDAAKRINVLIGAFVLVGWGNGACHWWSYVTHGSLSRSFQDVELREWIAAVRSVLCLPESARQKIEAALYWIREPGGIALEFPRGGSLRRYSAYWNAFESVVEAVNILRPRHKLTKAQKQKLIDQYLADRCGRLTPGDIAKCYREIVNPGFVGKAEHALRVCFGDGGEVYIQECFRRDDRENRLYDIRNAINHGTVDAENLDELARVESRLRRLWIMLWGMLGRVLRLPYPVDRELPESRPTQ